MEVREITKKPTMSQDDDTPVTFEPGMKDHREYVLCIGSCQALIHTPPAKGMRLFFVDYYPGKSVLNSLFGSGLKNKRYPDAIILSANIGNENVKDLLKRIQQDSYLKQIPVLLCSVLSQDFLELKKEYSCLDDAIAINKFTSEELLKKILFLKKIKKTSAYDATFQKVQPVMHRFLYSFDFVTRRVFDIIIGSLALCILSPIMLIIAVLIKLESKGPVFYAAYRAGHAYRIFKFYKFRSMVIDADSRREALKCNNQYADIKDNGPVFFKVANDPRITRLGSLLRKSSLDELPQLVNVLKGDMSLVGNRPLPLYEAATLTSDDCAERFLAPAGITGLWQVKKRGNTEMSASERVGLDIAYARNRSVWYDIKIMFKTPFSMTQKERV